MMSDKLKKNDIENKIKNREIDENVEKKVYEKLFYKSVIEVIVFSIMLILSIVFHKRILVFSKLMFHNSFIGTFLYFLFLIAEIGILIFLSLTVLQKKKKHSDWVTTSYAVYKKLDIPSFFCSIVCVMFFIITYIFTPCSVSGDSMLNTYQDGNKLICSGLFYHPEKNDVIVFDSSDYTGDSGDLYIKRVIAVAGDTVLYEEDTFSLFVNQEKVEGQMPKSQYETLLYSAGLEDGNSFVVPKHRLIVFGDNRTNSYDSRYFGLIDEKSIYGKVLFRLFPFGNPKKDIIMN